MAYRYSFYGPCKLPAINWPQRKSDNRMSFLGILELRLEPLILGF
ncbi:MAG: hypothetical protein Q7O66_19765 [Dehalococcoidia bacterium]|nr:hypothetical protein [Dehalococcoidia bacterium]